MPRWGGSQARSAIFRTKVREMSKIISGDSQPKRVPDVKPEAASLPEQPVKRRPSKTRQQAWAKIDAGKGTWKPK
jgi:hypothetical protein